MDRLTEQWFKTTIKNIKTKLEEKKIKTKITEAIQCLQEMGAVHCKKEDGYKIIVTVGSTIGNDKKSKGSKKEHNPPHAHVWSIDHKFYSRFQIVSETPPKTAEDLKKVEEDDMTINELKLNTIKSSVGCKRDMRLFGQHRLQKISNITENSIGE